LNKKAFHLIRMIAERPAFALTTAGQDLSAPAAISVHATPSRRAACAEQAAVHAPET
jgi:hypothetical protein